MEMFGTHGYGASYIQSSWQDYPDSHSFAAVVYFRGCVHNCPECHNPDLQRFDYADGVTHIAQPNHPALMSDDIQNRMRRLHTDKLVFSGGDPLYPRNLETVRYLLKQLSHKYQICIYTGYGVDYVKENGITGFKFLKCGKYQAEKRLAEAGYKCNSKMYLASSNQIMYDSDFVAISNNGVINI